MKKLDKIQYGALQRALAWYSREMELNIYPIVEEWDKPFEYGVNWSARGTQNVEDSRKYAENIMMAVSLCEDLNELEINVDYSDVDVTGRSEEKYQEQLKSLYDVMKMTPFSGRSEFINLALNRVTGR